MICIAGDFTKYDGHAVKQINRNIELLRYQRFGDDLLMLELVHVSKANKNVSSTTSAEMLSTTASASDKDPYASQTITYRLSNASKELRDLYEAVAAYLSGLGDDVQVNPVKYYVGFKRIKNFVCIEIFPQAKLVTCFVKLNPESVILEKGFTRDVRKIGHYGTGDLEVTL